MRSEMFDGSPFLDFIQLRVANRSQYYAKVNSFSLPVDGLQTLAKKLDVSRSNVEWSGASPTRRGTHLSPVI